jgi:uncharacterized membrane protein YgcG
MILREFFKRTLLEGGNLEIDGAQAQQIELKVHNRAYIVPILSQLLNSINAGFKASQGNDLWSPKVLKSRKYLSGSSLHFFNTDIPDDEFERIKPKVGDIDTQINKDSEPHLAQWLNGVKGQVVGNAKFLGYSRGNEQYSSLWELTDPPIKVQIDFEFVDYNDKDEPTDWAGFSHSSSWEDLSQGIKGVFHKYLIGAFTRLTKQDFLLRKMVGRGKARAEQDVPTTDNMISFAVSSKEGGGLRAKYEPVTDEKGRPVVNDGLPVMRALPAAGYEKDLGVIFQTIFGKRIDTGALKKLLPKTWSFTGLLEIMNLVLTPEEKEQVLDALVDKLFAPGAQGLYKGDAQRDMAEKNAALNYALKTLKITPPKNLEQMRQDYVKNYRVTSEGPVGLDRPVEEAEEPKVQAQLRKGMPHLRDLKPADFLDLVDELRSEGGRFKLQNIPLNVKIDGFGGRFGKNSDGKPFMGTSRTEPKYSAGFVDYHKQKGTTDPEILGRAANFDKLFGEMMKAIKVVDSKLGPEFLVDKQVTCEVLFLPFATQTEEGKLKFVGIEYDQLPQGVELVLVPYRIVEASTGNDLPDEAAQQLANLGQSGSVMFMSNRLVQEEGLDVTEIINPLENLEELKRIVSDTAGKRDRASLELRREVEAKLKPVQIALEKAIDEDPNIIGKDKLGQDYEGIVINTRLGPVKVTSEKQKDLIAQKNAARAAARAEQPRANSNKTAVVAIGSAIGHVGHQQLFNYAVQKAKQVGGDPYMFIGTAEGKDDPIPPAVKVETWRKLYPQYADNISTVSHEGGTLIQKIKHELINPLPGKAPRYDNIIITVGTDRASMADSMSKALMKAVNKFAGYEHVKVEPNVTGRGAEEGGTGVSGTQLRNVLKDPNKTPEQQFAMWNTAYNSGNYGAQKLDPAWIKHLMDIARKGMGITQQPTKQPAPKVEPQPAPLSETRLFNALIRSGKDMCTVCGQTPCNCTHINETDEKQYHGWEEYEEDKSAQVAEFLHEMQPELFSRYGDEYLMNVIQQVCRKNPQASVTQSASAVIRHLKSSVDEARMSAAVKLQRAFDRERAKSDASRRRGEEVMAQAKKDAEKKQQQGVAEGLAELVQIKYWQQDTMESGRWVKTKPMPRTTAEKVVDSFPRGEIVDVEQGVAEAGIDRRGFLKGLGAATLGATGVNAMAKGGGGGGGHGGSGGHASSGGGHASGGKGGSSGGKGGSVSGHGSEVASNPFHPGSPYYPAVAGARGGAAGNEIDRQEYIKFLTSYADAIRAGKMTPDMRKWLNAHPDVMDDLRRGPHGLTMGQLNADLVDIEARKNYHLMPKNEGVAEGESKAMAQTAKRLTDPKDGATAKLRAAGDKRREEHLKGRDIAKKNEAMLPKSTFAGSDRNKLGPAGQWKNTGPSKNRPARAGDLVGGAAESVNEDLDRIFASLIDKIIMNEAIQNNQRRS